MRDPALLLSILLDLGDRYFGGVYDCRIIWNPAHSRRAPRKEIKLGSYRNGTIRVHPALAEAWVPRFFLEDVIFHELLHHRLGIRTRHGRREMHPPEFAVMEALFPHHAQAQAWERANIDRLLAFGVREKDKAA